MCCDFLECACFYRSNNDQNSCECWRRQNAKEKLQGRTNRVGSTPQPDRRKECTSPLYHTNHKHSLTSQIIKQQNRSNKKPNLLSTKIFEISQAPTRPFLYQTPPASHIFKPCFGGQGSVFWACRLSFRQWLKRAGSLHFAGAYLYQIYAS